MPATQIARHRHPDGDPRQVAACHAERQHLHDNIARRYAVIGGDVTRHGGSPFGIGARPIAHQLAGGLARRDGRGMSPLRPRRQCRDEHDDRQQQQRDRRDPLDRHEPALGPRSDPARDRALIVLGAPTRAAAAANPAPASGATTEARRRRARRPSRRRARTAGRRRAASDPPATDRMTSLTRASQSAAVDVIGTAARTPSSSASRTAPRAYRSTSRFATSTNNTNEKPVATTYWSVVKPS